MKTLLTREEIHLRMRERVRLAMLASLGLIPVTLLLCIVFSVLFALLGAGSAVIGILWLAVPAVIAVTVVKYVKQLRRIENDCYIVEKAVLDSVTKVSKKDGKSRRTKYEAGFDGGKYILRSVSRSFIEMNSEGESFYIVFFEKKEKNVSLAFNTKIYDLGQ